MTYKYYVNYNGAPGGTVVRNAQIYAGPNQGMPPGQYGNGYYQQPGMPYQQGPQVPMGATGDMGMGYNAGQVYNPEMQQYYSTPAPQGVNVYSAPNIEPPAMQPQQQAGITVGVEPISAKSEHGVEIIERREC